MCDRLLLFPLRMGTRVFVGGLTYRVRERDLEKFFRKYGRIKEVAMKNGFAFVEFDDYRDADDAVYELNGKELLGERVSVEKARGTPRGSDVWRGRSRSRGPPPPPRRRSRVRDKDMDVRMHDRHSQLILLLMVGSLMCRYGPPTRTEYRLVVENLSSRVSWQRLREHPRNVVATTRGSVSRVTRLPNNLSQAEPRALWTKRNLTDPLRPMGQPKLLAPYGVACPVPCGWTMNWAWSVVPFVCP
uniref:RRM domain-containing protein n=1 Tax=Timema poppense TaxID=170557 RepID=A0A7R9CZ75_TIMPO|nr:unnamed protein product [Timema poppensis]